MLLPERPRSLMGFAKNATPCLLFFEPPAGRAPGSVMHQPNSWSPSCQVIGRASRWRGILPVDHRAACERTLTGIVRVISTHRDVPPPTRQDGSTRNNLLCWFGRKHQFATLLTRRDFLDVPPPTRQDGATRNKVAGAAAAAAAAEVHQASCHLLPSAGSAI